MCHTCMEERDTGKEGKGKTRKVSEQKSTQKVVSNVCSIYFSWDLSQLHSCCTLVVHLMLLSVLHSLAHPVGRTTSVAPSDVCFWVCVYEMLLVLFRLFTPPGGHSLYHNICWPVWRFAALTAGGSNSRKVTIWSAVCHLECYEDLTWHVLKTMN